MSITTIIRAQKINSTLYMMKGIPQSNYVNPSLQPECKYFIGIPLFSSIYANYSNSSFTYNDFIRKGASLKDKSNRIDINSLHDALKTINYGFIETDYSILAFGMKHKDYYFTFDIINKTDIRGNFNKEMFTFLKDGVEDYKGKISNWGNYNLNAFSYNEIALGASKKIGDKWYIGAKVKILLGLADTHLKESNITATTSSNGELVTLHSKQQILSSLPMKINTNADGTVKSLDFPKDDYNLGFFTNTSNLGLAFDLGITYQINEDTKFYASILDLGSITWKSDVVEFSQDAKFKWDNNTWSQSGKPAASNYKYTDSFIREIADTLEQKFRADTVGIKSYRTFLPIKIYMGTVYDINRKWSLGALLRTSIYKEKALASITLLGNSRLKKGLDISASYTIAYNSYTNIGLGLATRIGEIGQFYFVTDNILAGIVPRSMKLINFRFGINLLLGCERRKGKNSCTINNNYKKYYRKRR